MELTVEVYCDVDHADPTPREPSGRWRVVVWQNDPYGYPDTRGYLGDPYPNRHFEKKQAIRLQTRIATRLALRHSVWKMVDGVTDPEPIYISQAIAERVGSDG